MIPSPTQRAPDPWKSTKGKLVGVAAFSGIFLASGFSCSQAESTPAHTQVTQAVYYIVTIIFKITVA
jgi:hypothetical protein